MGSRAQYCGVVPLVGLLAGCSLGGTAGSVNVNLSFDCERERRLPTARASDTISAKPSLYLDRLGFVAASVQVPGGFAGLIRERVTGALQVQLVDPSASKEARLAIEALLADVPVNYVRTISPADVENAEIVRVRWSFAELYDWFVFLSNAVTSNRQTGSGVRGTGIDIGSNRVVVGVGDSASAQEVRRILSDLHPPCDLVRTEFIGPIVP